MRISQAFFLSSILISTTFLSTQLLKAQNNEAGLTEAERSCQEALDSGSPQDLTRFLRDFPSEDTVCNSTASTVGDADEDSVNDSGGGGCQSQSGVNCGINDGSIRGTSDSDGTSGGS